jgi:WD40 repeat protein
MSSAPDAVDILIELAAQGIAPLVTGSAAVLEAGSKTPYGQSGTEPPRIRGINYFGPPIVERWLREFASYSEKASSETLARLAGLSASRARDAASLALAKLASADPQDMDLAIEYLAAIPLAVRRSLIPDPATGRLALYPSLSAGDGRSLLRLLPADVPPFPIGSLVPGTSYELEELLGIGGFGAVYKARNRFEQNQPPRAIKFCLGASMVATLHRERAILDRLMAVGGKNWSNRIVRLYGYALDVQPPFLVYEYVPGGDLTSHLTAVRQKTGRGFKAPVAYELIRQVAEALAFAHAQGLVHRDLKPANVLVSGPTIKLTDFGIGGVVAPYVARWGGTGGSFSHPSSTADQASLFRGSGTPLYMSVEQRRGEEPDPRHDLYSLGVVWYQLLVGDVTRELHPGWPDELIEEFQTPPEHIELIQRCVGYYKKRPATAGDLLAIMTPDKAAAASPPATAPAEARDQAENDRQAAAGYDRLKAQLAEQIDHDALHKARATVEAILQLRPTDAEAREALEFIERRLASLPRHEIACWKDHQGWVRSVALTPDGKRALSGSDDGTVRVWDLGERRELRRLAGHTAAVMGVAMSADGRLAISGGWDGTLRIWDLEGGRQLRVLQGPWKAVKTVALTPDYRRALCGGDDHVIHLIDLKSGRQLGSLNGHTGMVQSISISADGRHLISGSDDRTVRIWELGELEQLHCLGGHSDTVTCVAFAPDARGAISGSSDYTVRLWDLDSGKETRRIDGHTNWINSLAVTGDGKHILTGSGGEIAGGRFRDGADTTLRLWELATGQELLHLDGHLASVTSVAIAADGRVAVSGGLDRTVRAWEIF